MRRMILTLITALTLAATTAGIVGAGRVFAQSGAAEQSMALAEQLYRQGEYALAAQTYQQLVDQGYADSTLFYNMGQAYIQAGDLGHALWSLRSAQAMDPRDAEIEAALSAVREQLAAGGQAVAAADNPMAQATALSVSWFSLNDLAIVALTLWFIFAALMLIFILRVSSRNLKRVARFAAPVIGVLLIVAMLALGSRTQLYNDAAEAVVVAQQVDMSNGPGPQFGVQFALPAGAEVDIVETRGDWVRIVDSGNGATGWAPADAVATVQPSSKG